MAQQTIRFNDGAAYERMMGVWSRMVGSVFLDWLTPAPGQSWIDVGCGNGAFTELLMQRCLPSEVQGIDPSEGQIAYARTRPGAEGATFQQGDALAVPFPAARFDAAVMALVIFFLPEPAKGVSEMARVVRPGGTVAAYVWDIFGGGNTLEPIWQQMRATGVPIALPPHPEATRPEVLRTLWADAGLEGVETHSITVQRSFADFDEFWSTTTTSGAMTAALAALDEDAVTRLREAVRAGLMADAHGKITYSARAHAIKGSVPV